MTDCLVLRTIIITPKSADVIKAMVSMGHFAKNVNWPFSFLNADLFVTTCLFSISLVSPNIPFSDYID